MQKYIFYLFLLTCNNGVYAQFENPWEDQFEYIEFSELSLVNVFKDNKPMSRPIPTMGKPIKIKLIKDSIIQLVELEQFPILDTNQTKTKALLSNLMEQDSVIESHWFHPQQNEVRALYKIKLSKNLEGYLIAYGKTKKRMIGIFSTIAMRVYNIKQDRFVQSIILNEKIHGEWIGGCDHYYKRSKNALLKDVDNDGNIELMIEEHKRIGACRYFSQYDTKSYNINKDSFEIDSKNTAFKKLEKERNWIDLSLVVNKVERRNPRDVIVHFSLTNEGEKAYNLKPYKYLLSDQFKIDIVPLDSVNIRTYGLHHPFTKQDLLYQGAWADSLNMIEPGETIDIKYPVSFIVRDESKKPFSFQLLVSILRYKTSVFDLSKREGDYLNTNCVLRSEVFEME